MDDNEQKSREAIADQAAERFVANDDGLVDERASEALLDWLKASPTHIEALLGVSAIARDLPELRSDPAYSVEAMLEVAGSEEQTTVQSLWPRPSAVAEEPSRHWPLAAAAMAVFAVVCVGLFLIRNPRSPGPIRLSAAARLCIMRLGTRSSALGGCRMARPFI